MNWLCRWLGCALLGCDYNDLSKEKAILEQKLSQTKAAYQHVINRCDNLRSQINDCASENNGLKKKIEDLEVREYMEEKWEAFWNNKYPKKEIVYAGRRIPKIGEINIDVRDYFCPIDKNLPVVSGTTNDTKALNALKWVRNNFKYVSDKSTYGYPEYWLMPWEAIKTRKGDCEDGAILMANIMLKSGIPYWRIRLNAGDVKGGGHAYVTYCRETDNQFCTLDWCYWYKSISIKNRALHRDERDYYDIWFSWNSKHAFGSVTFLTKAKKELPIKWKK